MKGSLRIVGFCVAVWVSLVSSGCAGFAGKLPPTYTYDQIPRVEQKPAVSYDAKFLALGRENAPATQHLNEEVRKVFLQSGVFSSFEAAHGSGVYHISVKMETDTNEGLAFLSGFISGFTFLILPGYERDEVTLTVDVKRGNDLIKQYVYKDHIDIWVQILLVALMPTHFPNDVARDLMDHMLLKFVHDVSTDKILTGGARESDPPPQNESRGLPSPERPPEGGLGVERLELSKKEASDLESISDAHDR